MHQNTRAAVLGAIRVSGIPTLTVLTEVLVFTIIAFIFAGIPFVAPFLQQYFLSLYGLFLLEFSWLNKFRFNW